MRLLFVTDLHGHEWKYERALELARASGAQLIVNGGDMFPHVRAAARQAEFIETYLDGHFARCQLAGVRYLAMAGNDDLLAHDGLLRDVCHRYPLVSEIGQGKVEALGHEFVGCNLVPDYPFRLKDRARMDRADFVFPPQHGTGLLSHGGQRHEIEDWPAYARTLPTLEDELERLPVPEDPAASIYVIHGPPAGLGLDVTHDGSAVGSAATAHFLAVAQPLLALHGHIHESPRRSGIWQARLGRTLCVQPGQEPAALVAVVIDVPSLALERHVLHA